ncbi:hypothetical protein [Brachybacterium aquaticum]|uniref:TRAP-type C4-dicarboxylate transport system substrate-binding protein n=1 Tax=Brachybacterium aquaticum TaxID=1432564 RepID=A0A841AEC8_9MICO|nr:hypothetical protein [Brachybacterium aquaticum]MBB5832313.1 TRAP-type C4-dicarboxylate transport system substrate-binding protein [Brachybacterium aquaticum]
MRSTTTARPPGPRPGRRALLTGIPVLGAGALAMAGCAPTDAGAATDVENILTVSLNQTETHPSYLALTYCGERLAEATEGRCGARIYANEALGAQQEVVQLVSDGSVAMAVISAPQVENLSMAFRPLNLPGAFVDIAHQTAVLGDESIVGELFSSLEDERRLRVLGGFTQGSRHVYTDREAFGPAIEEVGRSFLATPEDEDLYERVRALAEDMGAER